MTPPEIAQLYLSTELTVEVDDVWIPAQTFIRQTHLSFHVITAWNPGDKRFSVQENMARNKELYRVLQKVGSVVLPARGSDPTSDYFEDSWAVIGLTDEQAIEHGRRFEQVAVFRISHGLQMVLGCFTEWSVSPSVF